MEFKKLGKYFILIFMVSFLIINWNDISWVFNYRAVSAILSDFFQRDQGEEEFSPSSTFASSQEARLFEYSEKENSVEIPEIEVLVPLIFIESLGEKEIEEALNKGVVHFPGSALPGEPGQTIIIGHSAIHNWPKTKYAWVFTYLNELAEGDEIFIYFNHQKYSYYVTQKIFLDRGKELPEAILTTSENVLTLLSCWPPGKDVKRIAVEAALNK